jgi:hypothetical protein
MDCDVRPDTLNGSTAALCEHHGAVGPDDPLPHGAAARSPRPYETAGAPMSQSRFMPGVGATRPAPSKIIALFGGFFAKPTLEG